MVSLSKRSADTTLLLSSLERDPLFNKQFLRNGFFNQNVLQAAIAYVVEHYSAGESEAEEAINHLLRGMRQRRSMFLSNRLAQQQQSITIPGTDTHGPRTIPIKAPESKAPPIQKPLTIDAQPPTTPQQKTQDLTKPIVNQAETRQQKVVDAIKAAKVAHQALADAMYSVQMITDSEGDVMSKTIEAISAAVAKQTATTVKQLASPLVGGG